MLVIGAGNSMLLAVAPPLVRELQLGDASVGWIFSLSALLWVFASPYWGRLSDNVGRKPTIALGLFAYSISMAGFCDTLRDSATIGVEQNSPMLTPGVQKDAVAAA